MCWPPSAWFWSGCAVPRMTDAISRRMKLIHHAIRMAAFNTAQSLARAIATGTGYARADDEAHALKIGFGTDRATPAAELE